MVDGSILNVRSYMRGWWRCETRRLNQDVRGRQNKFQGVFLGKQGIQDFTVHRSILSRKPAPTSSSHFMRWISHRNHISNICGAIGPLHLLKADGSHINYSQFLQALAQLGLSGHSEDCIGTKDIKELWEQIDTDGDGVIDISDFSVCPSPFCYVPTQLSFFFVVFLLQLIC
ncbi:uncharacterized protein LOC131303743 isoform X2 [Rhododendron vialii]|uniref:uncharacterized protein LOC131303743 isoform X2 n=1 Tax=Rhododendron vialii TaxID=182163 RepID=UPI00265D961B|nr:uncharacterized protein LOC131303743 isoform X2 [Rhododendron vialii]